MCTYLIGNVISVNIKSEKKSLSASYHHGNLANSLKEKALLIIKKRGLPSLSLRILADKCGVSATAVYRHYKSKEHLLAILAEEGLNELQHAMSMAKEPRRLQQMGLAYIQFALHDPLRFRLTLEPSIDKTKFPSLLKKHHHTYEIVKSEVERCVQNGLMVGDIDNLTRTAWAIVHGTALLLLENQFPKVESELDHSKIALEITSIVGRGLSRID